jgi:hypothetical protein
MLISKRVGRIVSGAASLALLAGCSGGSSGTALPAANPAAGSQSIARGFTPARAFMPHGFKQIDALRGIMPGPSHTLRFDNPEPFDPAAPKAGVYGANYGDASGNQLGGYFNLYAIPGSSKSKPVCSNGGLNKVAEINGMGVDSTGTLWVPGFDPSNLTTGIVLTFTKLTCTEAKTSFTDKNGEPSDIAFTTTGTTYVADILNDALTSGYIGVYPKGKTSPTSTLKPPGISTYDPSTGSGGFDLGVGTDSKNNVYTSYENAAGATDIAVFAGGKGKGKILQNSSSVFYEGITFDKKGNMVVASDSSSGGDINIFKPPFTGSPTVISAQGSPVDLKLDSANKNLYVGDAANNTIDVYAYPGGKYEYSITVTTVAPNGAVVEGVAVDPSANS